MRWLLWTMIGLPMIAWGTFHLYHEIWWVENIVSAPSLFLVYYTIIALICLMVRFWVHLIVCVVVVLVYLAMTPKSEQSIWVNCNTPMTVVQYNLYYGNQDVNAFINYLIQNQIDLVVLQEVAPEEGVKFFTLDDLYPYRYGGQEGVGYPSSQMILSRKPLTQMSVFYTPDGHNIISGVWHPTPQKQLPFMTAHPPSPRTEELWHRRNAVIRTIQTMVEFNPSDEMLIVGDFNLSATSLRFATLFPEFETAPVASWPNWSHLFDTPAFTMLSIDHLWLKSLESSRRICNRTSKTSMRGSDHKMVVTQIGY
ncbi:endonuclease/exonuclease/phosphatase family protein [Vibrio sp. NTOU-M3]|uniref:endonuclease/exonuclease/phosphatase family protein n=1 Tax=Vibrio sp. NTOU-M3 TaxID=3234954 RepID=UPI00349F746A